jgi:hypothetical protein
MVGKLDDAGALTSYRAVRSSSSIRSSAHDLRRRPLAAAQQRSPLHRRVCASAPVAWRRAGERRRRYLILPKHSFRRSRSERTCETMVACSAAAPLLANSAEVFLSKFCCQSRIATLVARWASAAALRYVCMQVSASEHDLHSGRALERRPVLWSGRYRSRRPYQDDGCSHG